jgi:hypothetical protein
MILQKLLLLGLAVLLLCTVTVAKDKKKGDIGGKTLNCYCTV